jgi:uncharacterized membrane protein
MKKILLLLIILVVSSAIVSAGELYGTIYDFELSPVPGSIVRFTSDSGTSYKVVSTDGDYSLNLTPGKYLITLQYRNITTEDSVLVAGDKQLFDLILFESFDELDLLTDADSMIIDELPEVVTIPLDYTPLYVSAALLLCSIGLLLLPKKKALDDPLADKLLELLRSQDGRSTQKELRKQMPCSEAKVSLIIAELEARGEITKIRKGRANIITLHVSEKN